MVRGAGEQFRFYQKNHELKGDTHKADANKHFAEKCEKALELKK